MKAHVKQFENLLEYQSWLSEQFPKAIARAGYQRARYFEQPVVERTLEEQPDWYGRGTTYRELSQGITTYKDPQLIERLYSQVEDQVSAITSDRIKKRKVRYNAVGMGVFSFDRVAMGLYRQKEYFSPSLNRIVEPEEVRQDWKGYVLIEDNSPVEHRWEIREDGSPRIRTTSKYIYAYFPKVRAENRAVEIFIGCGGHFGLRADQFLYSGICAIVVAQLLEKARIRTKISVVIGSSPDQFENVYACMIPVKNYEETLDMNLIALLSSDPRFFRYDGFKGIYAIYHHFGKIPPSSLGAGFTNIDHLKQLVEQSDYARQFNTATHKLYMGWAFDKRATIESITRAVYELADKLNT